mgnify:CR=1 FL=1|tara:strand:- start:1123 stop:1659 length:537 start_codon:yes stop_codon:yes gene_type:complete
MTTFTYPAKVETPAEKMYREDRAIFDTIPLEVMDDETPYDAELTGYADYFSSNGYLGWRGNRIPDLVRKRAFYLDPQSMVGQPATYRIGSDCYPLVVVKVSKSGAKIWLNKVEATRTDSNGMSESQDYSYDIEGASKVATDNSMIGTRRKRGDYAAQGCGAYAHISVGYAKKYSDPHF